MAVTKDEILDAISKMSVMEVVELIADMEKKFNVTAAAPVAVAAGGGGGGGGAAAPAAEVRVIDVPPVAGAALLGLDHVNASPAAAARLRAAYGISRP